MRVVTLFFSLTLWLAAVEPIAFGNPHPLSGAHFNPVMDGTKERFELTYVHASIYEDNYDTYGGEEYHKVIDYESSQLGIFYRTNLAGDLSFTFNGDLIYNHNGFLDHTIVWVHDHTGSTGGRWRQRKEAPRDVYRFSVTDPLGNDLIGNEKRWMIRGAFYAAYQLPFDLSVRLGFKPPWEKDTFSFYPQEPEYALTMQKAWMYDKLEIMADASVVHLEDDPRYRDTRMTANLLISYNGYYIQYNYVEPVFTKTTDSALNTSGGVYVFGHRSKNFFWGAMEDFTLYNNPDVALIFGWEF